MNLKCRIMNDRACEAAEVIEEQLIRNVSKDYLEMMEGMLFDKHHGQQQPQLSLTTEIMEDEMADEETETETKHVSSSREIVVSDVGRLSCTTEV